MQSKATASLLINQRLKTLPSTSPSTTSPEFSTPISGGSGGNLSYILDCGNGAVTAERIDKRGMELDVLGIICQHVNPQNGILENNCSRGPVGGMGNNSRSSHCPAGQVVRKIVARSGLFVDGGIFFFAETR